MIVAMKAGVAVVLLGAVFLPGVIFRTSFHKSSFFGSIIFS